MQARFFSVSCGVGDPSEVSGREWKSCIVIHFTVLACAGHTALTSISGPFRPGLGWSHYGTGYMSPLHKQHLASSLRPLYPSKFSGKNQF